MKVYYNGPILTMEDATPNAEILIEDQGKIVYVGDAASAPASDGAEKVDLQGHTLMPAFIDGHGHFCQTGTFLKTCLLQSAESDEDIVRLMKEYAAQHEDMPAIIGMGYDHNFLTGGKHPTRFVLDEVSTEKPVIILHTSMHMAVANTKLLEIAGITKDSPEFKSESACVAMLMRMYQALTEKK